MKNSKLNNAQIIQILCDVKNGEKIIDVCNKYDICRQTFYNLYKKYKDLNLLDLEQIKNLENKIKNLEKKLREKELEVDAFKDILEKKFKAGGKERITYLSTGGMEIKYSSGI